MMQSGTILLGREGTALRACVMIEKTPAGSFIGLLASDPDMQNRGLGKAMLHAAEQYACRQLSATEVCVSVLSVRAELQDFYRRRGYVRIEEEVTDYPVHAGVGTPLMPGIQVWTMKKDTR